MRGRIQAVLACCAALAAGARGDAEGMEIQELPPLQRPSPEARAGLPEVRGVWRFAGFEIPAADTTLVREQVYTMTPPGEIRILAQRLDSIAGQYVRDGAAFSFTGEVRRDSALTLVAFSEGIGQFAAGHVRRDTFWIELTSFSSAQGWPRGTRAALVRRLSPGAPFRRLLGGAPIYVPVDSTRMRDSIRMDSLRRAGVVVPPGAQPPAPGQPLPGQPMPGQPGQVQPGARPTVPAGQPQRPQAQPQQQRPPVTQPRPQQPRPQPQRPPAQQPPAQQQPVNEPAVQPTPPRPDAPRDTLRFGDPP